MTEGNTLKKICIFAAPCILGRILQNLYTLVDSFVAGKTIDATALAAVGATGSLISLFTDTVIGLMSGFSVSAGKAYGAKDGEKLKKIFANSLLITALLSLLTTILGMIFAKNMLILMRTPNELLNSATLYLKIIFLGISASIFYNFLCEMLRAVGNSRMPLAFLAVSSILHIMLILLFTIPFDGKIVDVALSTVLSQALSAVLCITYIRKKVPEFKLSPCDLIPNREVIIECLRIGIPMAVTNFIVSFGGIILSFVTNNIGTEYVTAYTAASRIGYLITTPIFGFATAASVFASQNLGAGKLDRIKKGVREVNILVTLINCVLFVIFFLSAKPILSSVIGDDAIAVDAGVMYLRMRCTSMFVLTFAAVYKMVLTGLGCPFFPTLSGILEITVRYIVPITLSAKFGFISVPLTDAASWTSLAILLTPAYIYTIKKLKRTEVSAK